MGLPEYADVQWLWWLRTIGVVWAFQEGRLADSRPFFHWSAPWYAQFIMDRCLQVPAAYWTQIVDEDYEKLLAIGIEGETVEKVRRWLERELTLSA